MRAKRSKQYRKLMQQYQLSFNFREPYQVLLDAGVIIAAARFKMQLGHLLQSTLHGHIKPMITQCCIRHLYQLETKSEQEKREKEAWIEVAKAAERRRCGHHELEQPLEEVECIESCVDPKGNGTNKNKYVVASQQPEIRQAMREIPGVPIVYINRSVMILEPMAAKTAEIKSADERSKIRAGLKMRRDTHTTTNQKRKRDGNDAGIENGQGSQVQETSEQGVAKKRKVKGPKGPNPLSVKKAKKDSITTTKKEPEGHKVSAIGTMNDTMGDSRSLRTEGQASHMHDEGEANLKRKRKRKRKVGSDGVVAASSSAAGIPTDTNLDVA